MTSKFTMTAVALAATLAFAGTASFAQSLYETPDGHQTIGPSQMAQQPSVNQEMVNKATGNTVPPATGPDLGGVPGVQTGSAGSPATRSGNVANGPVNPAGGTNPKAPNLQRQTQATAPGAAAQPGSIILPQGEASTVRVGPVQPTPIWVRGILAFWLLLQFAAAVIVAVLLTVREKETIDEQGGHMIRPDFREPNDLIANT